MARLVHRRGMDAFIAVLAALIWSIGFAVWALTGDASTTCTTTTAGETCSPSPLSNGHGRELLAVLAPVALCLTTWALLRIYCTRGSRLARVAATVLVALFAALCVLAMFTVGLLLAPVAVFLVLALATTEPPPEAIRRSPRADYPPPGVTR